MNRRILAQVSAPAVISGFLLLGACLVCAWYVNDFDRAQAEVARSGPRRDYQTLAQEGSVRHIFQPCQRFFEVNEQSIVHAFRENERISRMLQWFLLLLGLGGPLSGLLLGYGIARGLSRSIYHLSVH